MLKKQYESGWNWLMKTTEYAANHLLLSILVVHTLIQVHHLPHEVTSVSLVGEGGPSRPDAERAPAPNAGRRRALSAVPPPTTNVLPHFNPTNYFAHRIHKREGNLATFASPPPPPLTHYLRPVPLSHELTSPL